MSENTGYHLFCGREGGVEDHSLARTISGGVSQQKSSHGSHASRPDIDSLKAVDCLGVVDHCFEIVPLFETQGAVVLVRIAVSRVVKYDERIIVN